MAVTVGRIEYVIGADGRILEREMRSAAKKGGKKGGETLNDEMIGAFKRKWGGPSGFAATLSKSDQKVIAHFNKLGLFTSKAYADRFAKSIQPKYEATAKKLVDHFNTITKNGTVIDLSRIFKGGPQAEAQIRQTRDLMVELSQAFSQRLAQKPQGFDVGPLKRFITELDHAVQNENWDLLPKRQVELNAAVLDGVDAIDKYVQKVDDRRVAMTKSASAESEAARSTAEWVAQVEKLVAAGDDFTKGGFVRDPKALAAAAREAAAAEEERIRLQIRANRVAIDKHNLSKQQLDLDEELAASARLGTELVRLENIETHQLNQERDHAVRATQALLGSKVQLSDAEQDIVDALSKEIHFTREMLDDLVTTNYLYEQRVDLSEDLIAVQDERIVQEYNLNKAEKQGLKNRLEVLKAQETEIDGARRGLFARKERITLARAAAQAEDDLKVVSIAALHVELEKIAAGRELHDLRNDELNQVEELLGLSRDVEVSRAEGILTLQRADRALGSIDRGLDRNSIRIEENVRLQRIMTESLAEVRAELASTKEIFQESNHAVHQAAVAAKAAAKEQRALAKAAEELDRATRLATSLDRWEDFITVQRNARDEAESLAGANVRELDSLHALKSVFHEVAGDLDDVAKSDIKLTKANERAVMGVKKMVKAAEDARLVDEHLLGVEEAMAEAVEETTKKTEKKIKATKEIEVVEKGVLQTRLDEVKATKALEGAEEQLTKGRKKAKDVADTGESVAVTKAKKSAVQDLTTVLDEDTDAVKKNVTATVTLTDAQQRAADRAAAAAKQTRKFAQAKADLDALIGDTHAWNRLVAAEGSVADATVRVERAFDRMSKHGPANVVAQLAPLRRRLLNYVTASNAAQTATAAAAATATQATTATNTHTAATTRATTATNNNAQAHRNLLAQLNAQITSLMGNRLAWDRNVQAQGSVYQAMVRTQQAIQALASAGGPSLANTIARMNNQLQAHVQASNNATRATNTLGTTVVNTANQTNTANQAWYRHGNAIRAVTSSFRQGTREAHIFGTALNKLGDQFKDVGTRSDLNPRAIAAIVAVLGEPIAVLAGSLGPALLAVGSALGAAVAGVGVLAVAFSVLKKEIGDLPPQLQDVAGEFKGLQKVLGGLQLNIASAVFSEMDGTFERLGDTISALTPAFQTVGQSVGRVFDALSRNTAQGTTGFGEIERFLVAAGPMFESIADTAGTFLLSLLTGFRKVQPFTDKFLDWLQDLANGFDAFIQGSGFEEWLDHSMDLFASLNGLLSAMSTMLDNLVTDEAVKRTDDFIDGLAAFMPHLENIIALFGELDVLGLVTTLLNGFGDALINVQPLLENIASAVNEHLAAAVATAADAFSVLVTALWPVIYAIQALLDFIPPQVTGAIAIGLVAIAGALGAIAAVTRLAALPGILAGIVTQFSYLRPYNSVLGRVSTGLANIAGRAAALGLVAVAIAGIVDNIDDWDRAMRDVDDEAADLVSRNASLRESFNKLNDEGLNGIRTVQSWDGALTALADSQKDVWSQLGMSTKALSDPAYAAAIKLKNVLADLDPALAKIASVDTAAAAEQFRQYATELGATSDQYLVLLDQVPLYKAELVKIAEAADGTATSQDLLKLATEGMATGLEVAKTPLQENKDLMIALKEETGLTAEVVDTLADAIRNFGADTLDTRAASRAYEQSILDLNKQFAEHGFLLSDANDLSAEARQLWIDNNAQVDEAITGTKEYAASIFEETQNKELANAALDAGREALRKQIEMYDPAGLAAGEYNDILNAIPTDIETLVKIEGEAAAKTAAANITATLNGIKDKNVRVYINPTVTAMRDSNGNLVVNGAIFGAVNRARGGVSGKPQLTVFGEAGPEALVPLNRPLSQVDPSVRALSAIAQGMTAIPRLGGNPMSTTAGRGLTIEAGAIQIQGSMQPERAATLVVNRIAERLS